MVMLPALPPNKPPFADTAAGVGFTVVGKLKLPEPLLMMLILPPDPVPTPLLTMELVNVALPVP